MRGQNIRKMKCLYDNKEKCRRDLWVETAAAEAAEREVLHPEEVPLQEEALLQEAVLQGAVGSAEGERHVYLPAAVPHRGAAVRLQETAVLHRGTDIHQGTAAVRHQAEADGREQEAAVYRQEAAQRQGAAGVLPVSLRGIRHLTGVKAVSGGRPRRPASLLITDRLSIMAGIMADTHRRHLEEIRRLEDILLRRPEDIHRHRPDRRQGYLDRPGSQDRPDHRGKGGFVTVLVMAA